MAVPDVRGASWTRKHDNPSVPLRQTTARIAYPRSLAECIELCATRGPNERLTAAGSHWALSDVAVSDVTFVDTHDPNNLFQAMGRTLRDVVPGCLTPEFFSFLTAQDVPEFSTDFAGLAQGVYPVHFETGKRVYQLYAELDRGDDTDPTSLAAVMRDIYGTSKYLGSWALPTMGNSGGQTVFGALTTGTHGGDFVMGPIADGVMAMHLVVDGGHHYWIEPETPQFEVRLTDDDLLRSVYDTPEFENPNYPGVSNFTILRDDEVFDAVRIGGWRFGIVYSVVFRAVRQFSLLQQRRLSTWSAVRSAFRNSADPLYRIQVGNGTLDSRFLQIAVCLTPGFGFSDNLVGVTKRCDVPKVLNAATGDAAGRAARVGSVVLPVDRQIGGPRFEFAGNSHTYAASELDPTAAADPSLLARACANPDFLVGVINEVIEELQEFVDSNGTVIAGTMAAVVGSGAGGILLSLLPALAVLLVILALFLAAVANDTEPTLGATLDNLRETLLDRPTPEQRAAGVLVWQCIASKLFESQQADQDYAAISYAVMDGNDYLDKSCNVNVDSLEVFFDATSPMVAAYVDALIAFETAQEMRGKAFVGFASLRFTGPTTALLGEERWPRTCVIEVAGLRDVNGVDDMIVFASRLARNRNMGAVLHWGQRNDSNQRDIQARFGDRPGEVGVSGLRRWRSVLAQLTANGRLDGFSNAASRRLGLEIVRPVIGALRTPQAAVALGESFQVGWDCADNPPATRVRLSVTSPSGVRSLFTPLTLNGAVDVPAVEVGEYGVELVLTLTTGQETRADNASSIVNVI